MIIKWFLNSFILYFGYVRIIIARIPSKNGRCGSFFLDLRFVYVGRTFHALWHPAHSFFIFPGAKYCKLSTAYFSWHWPEKIISITKKKYYYIYIYIYISNLISIKCCILNCILSTHIIFLFNIKLTPH